MKSFTIFLALCLAMGTVLAQGKAGGGMPHAMPTRAPAQSKTGGGPPHALLVLMFIRAAT